MPSGNNSTSRNPNCRVCGSSGSSLRFTVRQTKLYHCRACGSAFAIPPATLQTSHQKADHFETVDLERYYRSVKQAREASYIDLAQRLQKISASGTWLDVGCSYGWLMQFMNQKGFRCEGIEPSRDAAQQALQSGLIVHQGLFPEAVPAGKTFDILSFMDVLEHLESPREALLSAKQAVSPDGLLLIQVPDQACFLYRIAELLNRFSFGKLDFALRRLWLMDFDFPHLSYFTPASLQRLLSETGWSTVEIWRSPLGSPSDSLDRVSYAKQSGLSQFSNRVVALGVSGLQWTDTFCGHGGLVSVIARRIT